jgi:selenocysteine-specific elongation factor
MPHVVATAGHVDHGKSTLITALTGIDPDRLAEEKARGMTIDLGFAWLTLPSGREIGIVDVPGHERFVHNMLAGVGGVDCALLVVDATEGWRRQSEEHLAILDLVGVRAGVVALTKADLVDDLATDAPWSLGELAEAVGGRLAGTVLAGAEVVVTAAGAARDRGPAGLDELRAALDRAIDRAGEPGRAGRMRLPIDRAFSVRGAGTVVTGTLHGGPLEAEVEAELLPSGRRVRVRGLQGHGRTLERAVPVARVAANLAGVAVAEVARGEVLARPGQWRPTMVADARIRCLPGAPAPLDRRGALLLYAGTAESAVRLAPLDATRIAPGASALVRLFLERPLVLDAFEPVVLRDSGRDETVGGGPVLDPHPYLPAGRAWVRGTAARLARVEQLEAREAGGRDGLLGLVLAERGMVALADLAPLAGLGPDQAGARLADLAGASGPLPYRNEAIGLRSGPVLAVWTRTAAWSPSAWAAARQAVLDAVAAHHVAEPLAPGLPMAAAREAGGGPDAVQALLAEGALAAAGPAVRLPGHGVRLDQDQARARAAVEQALAEAGTSVLSGQELAELGADRALVAALERLGLLVRVAPGSWLGADALAGAVERLRAEYGDGRPFTAGEARTLLGTTRRTAIPLLEHLDRTGVTARDGDRHRVRAG